MTIARKNNWLLPALAALVLWGGWAFLPKLALQTLSIPNVIFYEGVGNLMVAGVLFAILKGKVGTERKAVFFTFAGSGIALLAIAAYYFALRFGPVAPVVTLTAMYPLVGLALARVVLKEKLNRLQLLAAAMAMVSIVLLVK